MIRSTVAATFLPERWTAGSAWASRASAIREVDEIAPRRSWRRVDTDFSSVSILAAAASIDWLIGEILCGLVLDRHGPGRGGGILPPDTLKVAGFVTPQLFRIESGRRGQGACGASDGRGIVMCQPVIPRDDD